MWLGMALSEQFQLRKQPAKAPPGANVRAIARQTRVEELRQAVANGSYKVSPQRLALKILVKALQERR